MVTKLARPWLVLLAALPFITALLSFQPDGHFAIWQLYVRQLWMPAQIFEIGTIIVAMVAGARFLLMLNATSKPLKIAGLTWLVSMILAACFAGIPNLAFFSLVGWITHVLFALAIIHLFRRWVSDERWVSLIPHAMAVGSAAFAALIVLFVLWVGLETDFNWISALPGFPNIRHPGYFLVPAMALSAGMIATGSRKTSLIHGVLLAVNMGFAGWSGSRGALVVFPVAVAVAMCLFVQMRRPKIVAAILLATASGCILSQVVPTPDHPAFNAIVRIDQDNSKNMNELSSGRTEIWQGAVRAISEHPLIGHGGNQFRLLVPAALKTYNHPHNSVLQFSFDWGLVGALALMTLLAILGWKLITVSRRSPERWLPFCLAAFSMAIFSLIDGGFYYNLPIMLFLTLALVPIVSHEDGGRSRDRLLR